jgi:hypothetical protein
MYSYSVDLASLPPRFRTSPPPVRQTLVASRGPTVTRTPSAADAASTPQDPAAIGDGHGLQASRGLGCMAKAGSVLRVRLTGGEHLDVS